MEKLTIDFKGIDFDCEFDYQPEEKQVMYYRDGSGYPGCPASIDSLTVFHKGTDFTEFLEEIVGLDKIEEEIWKSFERED